jgi:prephenate dehydrogenase
LCPHILGAIGVGVFHALHPTLYPGRAARYAVARGDREFLLSLLERARSARRNLPVGVTVAADLVELRVPVPDRPGVFAEVTTLAGRLGVNLVDFEVAHSLEGAAGVAVLVVGAADAPALEAGLHELGYHTSSTRVER